MGNELVQVKNSFLDSYMIILPVSSDIAVFYGALRCFAAALYLKVLLLFYHGTIVIFGTIMGQVLF